MVMQKICRGCSKSKDINAFYKHSKMKDGHLNICIECVIERARVRRLNNPRVQEYDRIRSKKLERRVHLRKNAEKWKQNNPNGYKAHNAVSNALRDGKLKKHPCLFCGSDHVHTHHNDYLRPLDVVWLCAKCHARLHANFENILQQEKAF